MRRALILLAALGAAGHAHAADITAGKETATACAACHGRDGVSVSDDIPNLAGQKAKYISNQLKAFREGTRTNALMNAIAAQLDDTEIENLAAFFNSLPGAPGSATSEMLAEVAKTRVGFPANYKVDFTHYTTISFPKRKQVRRYYANDAALTAARDGTPLPHGSAFFVEVFKAKLDDAQMPIKGDDGHFVPDKLVTYTAMETQPGWGDTIPEILRNGDWNYAVFTAGKALKTDVNQARCLACHKPLTDDSYVFSIDQLRDKARM